jgi:hypothetical protein
MDAGLADKVAPVTDNAVIAELVATRRKGAIGQDNAGGGELGAYPPAKAHPLPSGSEEAAFEDLATSLGGFEAALVPYAVAPLQLGDLRGPRGTPLDRHGILRLLERHNEELYAEAARKTHVLFVPNDFFDAEHASKLRPFFQVQPRPTSYSRCRHNIWCAWKICISSSSP